MYVFIRLDQIAQILKYLSQWVRFILPNLINNGVDKSDNPIILLWRLYSGDSNHVLLVIMCMFLTVYQNGKYVNEQRYDSDRDSTSAPA